MAKYRGDKVWATLSEFAREFGTTYSTLSREVAARRVEPDGKDRRGKPLYRLGDVARAHCPNMRPKFEA